MPIIKKSLGVVNVRDFGAKGDGVADDTLPIQRAINSLPNGGQVLIPDGTYMIDVSTPILPKSNMTITLSDKAKLKAKPNSTGSYQILNVVYVQNVTIEGGSIEGERYEHIGTADESGMGITIGSQTRNIKIRDIYISKCWGDGIYIGGAYVASEIYLQNVICDDNRRQGISVTFVDTLTIRDSKFMNSAGTLPEAGIDIEPDPGTYARNITIDNVICSGNRSGLEAFGWATKIENLKVSNCNFNDNRDYGVSLAYTSEISIRDTELARNKNAVLMARDNNNVIFDGCQITGSTNAGVNLATNLQRLTGGIGTKNIVFNSCLFKNNGTATANTYDGVIIDNTDDRNVIDQIAFNYCTFVDDQATPTQRYGVTVVNKASVTNITFGYGNKFVGNVTGGKNVNDNNTSDISGKVSSLPTPNAAQRGRQVRIEGATGVADAIYTCIKLANDTYDWVQIS